jgi:hypothetical protein
VGRGGQLREHSGCRGTRQVYLRDIDRRTVIATIRALGRCAARLPKTATACIRSLVALTNTGDDEVGRIVTEGFRVGDRSRGRYATPADFLLHDSTPYRELRVRRWDLGVVHRSRTFLCRRAEPKSHDSQRLHRCTTRGPHNVTTLRGWREARERQWSCVAAAGGVPKHG